MAARLNRQKKGWVNSLGKQVLRIVIVLAAVGCLTAGFLTDGFLSVRSKAVTICRECIGLG